MTEKTMNMPLIAPSQARQEHFEANAAEQDLPPRDFPKLFGLRRSAVLEMAIFFAFMLIVDVFLGSGNRFFDVTPHPFFVIVVLISAQYGSSEGLTSALFASLVLLVGNLPEKTMEMDSYDYLLMVTHLPIMWIITALILGELRQRQIRERKKLRDAYEDALKREDQITDAYERLDVMRKDLEVQIASQMNSSLAVYKGALALERLNAKEIVSNIGDFVQQVIRAERFSVFLLRDNQLEAAITQNWDEDVPFARRYDANAPLYSAVVGERRMVTVFNQDDERLLNKEGYVACPILNPETRQVLGMFKIETCEFRDLNMAYLETVRLLCEWIGLSYANARRYEVAESESLVNPSLRMLSSSYYRRQADYLVSLGKRAGFDVTQVTFRLEGAETMPRKEREAVARTLSEAVRQSLRTIDQAFDRNQQGTEFTLLLPYTPTENAGLVVQKVQSAMHRLLSSDLTPVIGHTVQALYTAEDEA
jgi:hypothetical protein